MRARKMPTPIWWPQTPKLSTAQAAISADMLIPNAVSAEFFHTAHGTGFVDLLIDGYRETWPSAASASGPACGAAVTRPRGSPERRANEFSARSARSADVRRSRAGSAYSPRRTCRPHLSRSCRCVLARRGDRTRQMALRRSSHLVDRDQCAVSYGGVYNWSRCARRLSRSPLLLASIVCASRGEVICTTEVFDTTK